MGTWGHRYLGLHVFVNSCVSCLKDIDRRPFVSSTRRSLYRSRCMHLVYVYVCCTCTLREQIGLSFCVFSFSRDCRGREKHVSYVGLCVSVCTVVCMCTAVLHVTGRRKEEKTDKGRRVLSCGEHVSSEDPTEHAPLRGGCGRERLFFGCRRRWRKR